MKRIGARRGKEQKNAITQIYGTLDVLYSLQQESFFDRCKHYSSQDGFTGMYSY